MLDRSLQTEDVMKTDAPEQPDLRALSPVNLAKIYCTVLDINDKLQIDPTPTVYIDLQFRNITKALGGRFNVVDYRLDALAYLKNRGVVENHDCTPLSHMVGDVVKVTMNIPRFQEFKRQITAVYKENGREAGLADKPSEQIEKRHETQKDTDVVYEVKLTPAREILINGFLLAKLDFNSENDNIFSYIYENPNRTIGIEELAKQLGGVPPKKPLHKIIENCGFTLELKKLFFNISKTSIYFRNPIRRKELEQMGLGRLKLRCR